MPSIIEIPAKRERRCEPCQYHKMVNAFYGSDRSWRDYNCTHPEANADLVPANLSEEKKKLIAEIDALTKREGRHIGKTERQPDWCPLRREAQDGS